MLRDEARGRDHDGKGTRPRWAFGWVHQFDLVREADEVPYLTRWWLVNTPLGGIAVHRMMGPDARGTLHDHPFSFVSLVLRGGYVEQRLDPLTLEVDRRRIRRWNRMRKFDAHVITRLLRVPTWTLLWIGPKRREWGFWEPQEYAVFTQDGEILAMTARNPDGSIPVGGVRRPEPAVPSIWRWTNHHRYDSGHTLRTEERG